MSAGQTPGSREDPNRAAFFRAADVLRMQRHAGNKAVTSMLMAARPAQETVQRETPSDQGGPADDTNLEQDMRGILGQWQWAAGKGVDQFVTQQLSARLDALESGDWKSFFTSLVGNTIWASVAFNPAGWLAFGISMTGVAVASAPTVPSKSESAIPVIQAAMNGYINSVYDQLDPTLRKRAQELIKAHPGIRRYPALAEFLRASFTPELVHNRPDRQHVSPHGEGSDHQTLCRLGDGQARRVHEGRCPPHRE